MMAPRRKLVPSPRKGGLFDLVEMAPNGKWQTIDSGLQPKMALRRMTFPLLPNPKKEAPTQ